MNKYNWAGQLLVGNFSQMNPYQRDGLAPQNVTILFNMGGWFFRKFLPLEDFSIWSDLSVEEIRKKISQNVEPRRHTIFGNFSRRASSPYEGEVFERNFTINRIIRYRNSFLPMITGEWEEAGQGTEIRFQMRLTGWVLLFMVFWLGMTGMGAILLIVPVFRDFQSIFQKQFSLPWLIPAGMFIFGYALMVSGFKYEARKSRLFFSALLNGKERMERMERS